MRPTNEDLAKYVGGQLEIQNTNEDYLYRGEIARAWIEGDDLKVKFKWQAKMSGDGRWHAETNLDYAVSLMITSFSDIGYNRLAYRVMYVWETGVFSPPAYDGKLEPAQVIGLDLATHPLS